MPRPRANKKAKSGVVRVDFTGVEGRILLPENEYQVIVEEVKKELSDKGNDYLLWKFKTIHEDAALDNKPLYYMTSLQPQALWNLRNLLETLGIEVPDGPMDLDLREYVDCEMIAIVENDTYEGKKKSVIVDFMPIEEGSDVEVEVEGEEGGEEIEGITEEEIMAASAAELTEIANRYDLAVNFKTLKTLKKKQNAVLAACEKEGYIVEEGQEGGDEEESAKFTLDEVSEMSLTDLQDLIKDYELDVKLKDYKTSRKKTNAVIDALEAKGLLQED